MCSFAALGGRSSPAQQLALNGMGSGSLQQAYSTEGQPPFLPRPLNLSRNNAPALLPRFNFKAAHEGVHWHHAGSLPTPSATPPPPTPPLSHTPPVAGHGGHQVMGPPRLNQQQQLAASAAAMAAVQMAGANGHMSHGLHGGPAGRGHGLGRGGSLPVLSPPLPGSPEYQAAYQAAYQMALQQQQQMQLMMSGMNPMGQVRSCVLVTPSTLDQVDGIRTLRLWACIRIKRSF